MKYEYKIEHLRDNDLLEVIKLDITQWLNHHGKEGWELVSQLRVQGNHTGIFDGIYVFKRQLPFQININELLSKEVPVRL